MARYVSIFRRLFRRGPDTAAADTLIELLSRYSVPAAAASDETFRELTTSGVAPAGTRLVAAVALEEAGLGYAFLSRAEGQGAAHSGRLRLVGAHVLVDRTRLSPPWAADWRSPLRAMPGRSENDLGPIRSIAWQPSDATDQSALEAAQWLNSNDRVHRRVLGLLRDGSSGQFELLPLSSWISVGVYRYGADTPDPTALEALLTVSRTLVE